MQMKLVKLALAPISSVKLKFEKTKQISQYYAEYQYKSTAHLILFDHAENIRTKLNLTIITYFNLIFWDYGRTLVAKSLFLHL